MLRKVLLPVAALSLAAGSAALAQNEPEAERPAAMFEHGERGGRAAMLQRIDTNGDGAIQPEEFGAQRVERLRAADTNGDGTLSQEELQAHIMQREFERKARRAAAQLDVDGDGEVTLSEIEQHQAKLFALMDGNDDGKLEPAEIRRGHSFMGRSGMRMHGFGERGRHGPMMMEPDDEPDADAESEPAEE